MRVEARTSAIGLEALVVTSDDDAPFTVQRVVFNGRTGEKYCDVKARAFPHNIPAGSIYEGFDFFVTNLKRGDSVSIPFACSSHLLKADIYTDRGSSSVEFNAAN